MKAALLVISFTLTTLCSDAFLQELDQNLKNLFRKSQRRSDFSDRPYKILSPANAVRTLRQQTRNSYPQNQNPHSDTESSHIGNLPLNPRPQYDNFGFSPSKPVKSFVENSALDGERLISLPVSGSSHSLRREQAKEWQITPDAPYQNERPSKRNNYEPVSEAHSDFHSFLDDKQENDVPSEPSGHDSISNSLDSQSHFQVHQSLSHDDEYNNVLPVDTEPNDIVKKGTFSSATKRSPSKFSERRKSQRQKQEEQSTFDDQSPNYEILLSEPSFDHRNVYRQQLHNKHRHDQYEDYDHYDDADSDKPDRLAILLQKTKFHCRDKKDGYYADEEVNCEVFHFCQDRVKHSWLCPNGASFHQIHLICMPQSNENICSKSSKFHFVNDYLYKETPESTSESKSYVQRYYPETHGLQHNANGAETDGNQRFHPQDPRQVQDQERYAQSYDYHDNIKDRSSKSAVVIPSKPSYAAYDVKAVDDKFYPL